MNTLLLVLFFFSCNAWGAEAPAEDPLILEVSLVNCINGRFHCPDSGCTKSFTRKFSLKEHVTSDHLQRRDYECYACRQLFTRQSALTRHLKRGNCSPDQDDDDEPEPNA